MDFIRKKIGKMMKKACPMRISAVMAAVILILVVVICISSIMRANMQRKYADARFEMQEQVYMHLQDMTELFSRIEDPEVDVQHKLIPYMYSSFTGVVSLNTVLRDSYGRSSALLSDDLVADLDAAFDSYFAAYRGGGPTGLAQADMAECMADIQPIVDERFAEPTVDPNLMVVPNTPVPKK